MWNCRLLKDHYILVLTEIDLLRMETDEYPMDRDTVIMAANRQPGGAV